MLRPLSTLLLLLTALPARAAVVSLQDVEHKALAAGTTRAAKARIMQMDAELDAARSARHPVVTFNTEASVAPGGQLVEIEAVDGERFLVQGSRPLGEPGAFTVYPRYGGLLAVHANVFDFGRTSSRIRAAEHRAHATRTEEQAVEGDLLRAVREAYLGWAVAHARAVLAERHAQEGQARAEALRNLIAEGTRPAAEMNVADQDDIALGIEVSDARGALDHARLAIEQLVGEAWPDTAVPDLGLLEISVETAPPRATVLAAAALEQHAAASAAMADSVGHDHVPVISASGEAGIRGQSTSVFPSYRVAVTVTVPIWDGGLAAASARSARATADGLRAEATAARKAREDAQQLARSDLGRAQERLRLAERLRRLAENDVEQVKERFHLGATDLRAVLDARERLSRAEAQELAAKAERASAWLRAHP